MMLVSRNTLPLIHLFSRVLPVHLEVVQLLHQGVVLLHLRLSGCELLQPLAEGGVQGGVLLAPNLPGLLDQGLLGSEGDVLHEASVYESNAPSAEPGVSGTSHDRLSRDLHGHRKSVVCFRNRLR
jgi:hypothetical protein